MIRLILVFGTLLAALVGCATQPSTQQSLGGSAVTGSPILVATLATSSCEVEVAPAYTAAEVAIRVATARVSSGRLGIEAARQISALAKDARSNLDGACLGKAINQQKLAAAKRDIAAMQRILLE